MRLSKTIWLAILFPLLGTVLSCEEDSKEESDFDNWQQKNETALEQWASNSSYRKILTFSKDVTTTSTFKNFDYIYVEVLESSDIYDAQPLYTDTCRVAYRGHYIPTVSYPEGYIFDQTYLDEFDWKTVGTAKFLTGAVVDGFATALMNMRVGDRWRVRIPYMLGYGKSDYSASSSTIPGYSNLVFEIALLDFWSPGEYRSDFK